MLFLERVVQDPEATQSQIPSSLNCVRDLVIPV